MAAVIMLRPGDVKDHERAPQRVAAATSQTSRHEPVRRLLRAARLHRDRWADERELAHAILGTVVGAAAMAVASLHGTLGEVIASVLVTVAVYWAAERYAEVLAAAVHGPGRRSRLAAALRRGSPMIEAAYTPLVILVAVVLVTGDLKDGVLTALAVIADYRVLTDTPIRLRIGQDADYDVPFNLENDTSTNNLGVLAFQARQHRSR